jgi:hypothetical protein
MGLRDKFFGSATSIADAKAQSQSKVAQEKAKKEQKAQQHLNKQENKADSSLNKVAHSLENDIAHAIKKEKESLVKLIACFYGTQAEEDGQIIEHIRGSNEYKQMHEICARPDVNMCISIVTDINHNLWDMRQFMFADHAYDAGIKIDLNQPYSSSPDARLFTQPEPVPAAPEPAPETKKPALTAADQLLAMDSEQLQELLKTVKEQRPEDFEAAKSKKPAQKPPTL